jgi:hypothetical protein
LKIEEIEEAVDKSSDVYKHYTELKKKSVKELRDTIKGSHKVIDVNGFDKHGAISHILRNHHGNKKVAAAMGLDEANFANTMKKAVAAHERGDHKKAAYHLDNAKTARYAMKSTEISKHKDLLDKYKELRDVHEATFKVDIQGLPAMFIDAESAPQVKKTLRQLLKKPDDSIKGVDRVQPAEVKKHFRLKALGKEDASDPVKEAYYYAGVAYRKKPDFLKDKEKKEKENKPVKEEAGAGEEGTDKLVKKYKKDTPNCS